MDYLFYLKCIPNFYGNLENFKATVNSQTVKYLVCSRKMHEKDADYFKCINTLQSFNNILKFLENVCLYFVIARAKKEKKKKPDEFSKLS